jgi:hypothetical protein
MAFLPQLPAGNHLPTEFVVFYLRLPFELPLSQRSFIWTPRDAFDPPPRSAISPRWVSVRFRQFTAPSPDLLPGGFHEELSQLLEEEASVGPKHGLIASGVYLHTWCLATVGGDGDPGDEAVISEWFNVSLGQLNRIIRAYVARSGNIRVGPIAKEQLEGIVVWETRKTANKSLVDRGQLILHLNLTYPTDPVPLDLEASIATTVAMAEPWLNHPFVVYRDWLERAKHARQYEGDLESSLIFLQTASESLLRSLHHMAMVDEGRTSAEIQAEESRFEAFKTLVESGLPNHIGGRWDLTLIGSPVGDYWRDLYGLRNRIVHGAHYLSFDETAAAFCSYSRLVDHINSCLLRRVRSFPRTLLALLGEPGLRRRGRWSQFLESVKGQIAVEQNPYWWPIDQR